MNIGYLGDTGAGGAECGPNPCTFLDSIYAGWGSSECLPYIACMNPADPRVIGLVGAASAGLATDVGMAAGAGASALASSTNLGGFAVLAAIGLAIYLIKR